ncbi:28S ribosomal protein S5, mitochondrial [Pestalotiopsis sp. IQ-011]
MAALVRDANGNEINGGGQFGWFLKIGATPEAVAVLNDQPFLFAQLLVVLVVIGLQITFHWYIHYATLKPSQMKKKKDDKKGGKPPAAR